MTTVYVNLLFNSISEIDGVSQSFTADFYLTAYWIDNRVDPVLGFNTSIDWDPAIEFQNSLGDISAQNTNPNSVAAPKPAMLGLSTLPPGVWIKNDQRYVGTFSCYLPLQDFPFDVVSCLARRFGCCCFVFFLADHVFGD